MTKFKEYCLPIMIDAGEAPWLDETIVEDVLEPFALDPNVTLSEEESMARQEAIYQELLRTMPTRLEN
jgi:hypothetical protein